MNDSAIQCSSYLPSHQNTSLPNNFCFCLACIQSRRSVNQKMGALNDWILGGSPSEWSWKYRLARPVNRDQKMCKSIWWKVPLLTLKYPSCVDVDFIQEGKAVAIEMINAGKPWWVEVYSMHRNFALLDLKKNRGSICRQILLSCRVLSSRLCLLRSRLFLLFSSPYSGLSIQNCYGTTTTKKLMR
jgi:hypothetical protein